MDYFTSASAEETVACSLDDFRALAAAMHLEVVANPDLPDNRCFGTRPEPNGDHAPHGLDLYFDQGRLYLYGDDYVSVNEVAEDAWSILGTILTKARRPHLELGLAYHASKNVPGSMGGRFVRISANGDFVEASTVWPPPPKQNPEA